MSIWNPENYYIPCRYRLFGQTTKQPLSNFEPRKPWKFKQLWGLKPDPNYLWKKCFRKKNKLNQTFPKPNNKSNQAKLDVSTLAECIPFVF